MMIGRLLRLIGTHLLWGVRDKCSRCSHRCRRNLYCFHDMRWMVLLLLLLLVPHVQMCGSHLVHCHKTSHCRVGGGGIDIIRMMMVVVMVVVLLRRRRQR